MKYFALLKDKIEQTLKKTKNTLILTGGGTMCLLFMAITQLNVVKSLPYIGRMQWHCWCMFAVVLMIMQLTH